MLTNGKKLSEEYAQTPCFGDWDGDGDMDTIVGFISGPVKLYKNNGKFQFTEAGVIKVNSKELHASDGGPCITDWDGDGVLDLLMGDGEGGVHFYKSPVKGSMNLVTDENSVILAPHKGDEAWKAATRDATSPTGINRQRPGVRTKPFAADWNSDGKLDLLVGDFLQISKGEKTLTVAEKAKLAALEKELGKVSQEMMKYYQKYSQAGLKAIGLKAYPKNGLSAAQSKKYSAAYIKVMDKDKPGKKVRDRYTQLMAGVAKYRPQEEATGMVWVYLRK